MKNIFICNIRHAIFTLVLLFLSQTTIFCQEISYGLIKTDYLLFRPSNDIEIIHGCYECGAEQYIVGIRVDSSSAQSESTTHYFNHEIVSFDNICYTIGASAIGDSIVEGHKGISRCFTLQGEEIEINRTLKIGETGVLFIYDDGNYISSTVISHELESFFEVSDSVKTYALQLYDTENNAIDGPINDQVIRISKSYGLIQFFNIRDLSNANDDIIDLQLVSSGSLAPNDLFLTYGDIFEFEIDDEFHYQYNDISLGQDGYEYVRRIVADKQAFSTSDSISYTFNEHRWGWRIKNDGDDFAYETFEYDTSYQHTYADLSEYVLGPVLMPFEASVYEDVELFNSLMYSNQDMYNDRYIIRKNGVQLAIDDDCAYPPLDSWGASYTYYIEGCGKLQNNTRFEITEECFPCERLMYFMKGDETWGESLGVPGYQQHESIDIELYPNPAKELVSICFGDEISKLCVYNSGGEQILVIDNLKRNYYQIDISQYQAGIYFVRITAINGNVGVKKLLIE